MLVAKVALSFLLVVLFHFNAIDGHGMLMEPVNRSSAWRKNFKTPINYDDNALNCGGGVVSKIRSFLFFFNLILFLLKLFVFVFKHDPLYGGQCGICGDAFWMERPRPNENGGKYGTRTIVKT